MEGFSFLSFKGQCEPPGLIHTFKAQKGLMNQVVNNQQYHVQSAGIIGYPFLIIKGIRDRQNYATINTLQGSYSSYALMDKLNLRTSLALPKNVAVYCKMIRGWYKYPYNYSWQNRSLRAYILIKELRDTTCLISVNPADFPNYDYLLRCIRTIFNNDPTIDSARVTRLDCSVDVLRPFKDEIQGADFGKKRNYRAHSHNNRQTGLYVGRDPKNSRYLVTVYDKSLKNRLTTPTTRYETNSYPKNLTLGTLSRICRHKPFTSVKRYNLQLVNSINLRFLTFATYVQAYGLWVTKRMLNTSGNFQKTYSKYFTLQELTPDLNTIFQESIKSYFI